MSGTPQDANDALTAALGHIPATAKATRGLLTVMLAASERLPEGVDPELQVLKQLAPRIIEAVMTLESRIEVLEGRPGFADKADAILGKFVGR